MEAYEASVYSPAILDQSGTLSSPLLHPSHSLLPPSHPRSHSQSHPLTLSPSHPLTLSSSPSHPLTLSPSYPLTLSPLTLLTLSPPHSLLGVKVALKSDHPILDAKYLMWEAGKVLFLAFFFFFPLLFSFPFLYSCFIFFFKIVIK